MKVCLRRKLFAMLITFSISGCGTYVPQIQEAWDEQGDKNNPSPLESDINSRVFCDIKDAILDEYPNAESQTDLPGSDPKQLTFKDFGIQVALTLTVDETTTLA